MHPGWENLFAAAEASPARIVPYQRGELIPPNSGEIEERAMPDKSLTNGSPVRLIKVRALACAALALLAGCVQPRLGASGIPLRVMTYNIRSGNGALDGTAAEIRSLSPDIVALQEVDVHWDARSEFADQAMLLGEKLGMHVCFAPIYRIPSGTVGAPLREFGVALLSKYSLASCDNRVIARLSTQAANPVPAPMPGFLDAVVTIAGRSIHVYDTHLDYRADPSVRRRQVADMIGYLGDSGAPAILMGDLNAEPNAAELAPLLARMRDAWNVNSGAGLTYPAENPKKRIDYILVSGHFRARTASVPVTLASDHRPVVADLVFAER